MKILVLTSTFPRWHGDNEPPFVLELSKRIARTHEVDLVAPHTKGAAATEIMEGISVYRFRYAPDRFETLAYQGGIMNRLKENKARGLLVPLFAAFQLLFLIKTLRKKNYDIIHAHWVIPQGLLAVLARLLSHSKTKLLITTHGGDIYGLAKINRLKKWIIQKTDLLCFVSKTLQIDASKNLRLPNSIPSAIASMGVDAQSRFVPNSESRKRALIFVGRFTEKKGLDILLNALADLRTKGCTPQLTIIGGDEKSIYKMEKIARSLNIQDQCNFLGSITNEEVPNFLQKHTVFIFPSHVAANGDAEGLGLTAIEAMACECLLISSDIDTSREFVTDGETGLLFRPKDASHLSEKIYFALHNDKAVSRMASAGRDFVLKNYDWEKVCANYNEIYQSLKSVTS